MLAQGVRDIRPFVPFFFENNEIFVCLVRQKICFCQRKSLSLVVGFGHLFGNMSSGKAAGIGIFIVDPNVQSYLFPFIDGIAVEGMPFVRHIFRDHAWTGVNKCSSAAGIFKIFQHAVYFSFCNFSVPNHKGGCTVLG